MKLQEDFLHFIWKYQKLRTIQLYTSEGDLVQVIHPGTHNQHAGPDFLNAQLRIGETLWAGSVEMHLKSSHWYMHHHEQDEAYENVILHIVWEHDVEVFDSANVAIPTLELAQYVAEGLVEKYQLLHSDQRTWIPCEKNLSSVSDFVWNHWLERLFIERLETKAIRINNRLKTTNHHWEAVFFEMICRNFGLNINGKAFESVARSIPFRVLQKCRHSVFKLEALFFGQAGLLSEKSQDAYEQSLFEEFQYQLHKFNLMQTAVIPPQFFRLRPTNFPTLRLAQLAALYAQRQSLFSDLMACYEPKDALQLLKATASDYWNTHYQFGTESKSFAKSTSKAFLSLVLINTVAPMQFCYRTHFGQRAEASLHHFLEQIAPEKNSIIKKFNALRRSATSAMESQALLQLKKNYCDQRRCLECAIGNTLITA